jgi:hypothetical protein
MTGCRFLPGCLIFGFFGLFVSIVPIEEVRVHSYFWNCSRGIKVQGFYFLEFNGWMFVCSSMGWEIGFKVISKLVCSKIM